MNETKGTIPAHGLFKSFFMAGFECSIHKNSRRKRLDMIHATKHDKFAREDYSRLTEIGIRTAREGMRWHLIETVPGVYNFSCMDSIVEAAKRERTEVIWDICHFGWPDHLDVMDLKFPDRAADFAWAAAVYVMKNQKPPYYFIPVNEISFLSWIGGEEGKVNPYMRGKGFALKCQLVRAAIMIMDAIWDVCPTAQFIHSDPIINVIAHPERPQDAKAANEYCMAQYESWDMIAGRSHPELGGKEKYLGILGANFYIHNQWYHDVEGHLRTHEYEPISYTHPQYKPLSFMLRDLYRRYGRPLFIAETGAEDDRRDMWFKYVCDEVRIASYAGVPVEGICLYPILNHPGWEDDRHCHNGLWDYADENGQREPYEPLANVLKIQSHIFSLDHIHPLQFVSAHQFMAESN